MKINKIFGYILRLQSNLLMELYDKNTSLTGCGVKSLKIINQ